jgi:Protein of unknown function (DUF3365)
VKMGHSKAGAILCGAVALAGVTAAGCGNQGGGAAGGIQPQQMADALYAVISADRAVYANQVVDRLGKADAIKATERFQDEKTLPLPAQMLRMGAEHAQKTNSSFSYALLSQWPINKQNSAKTDAEKAGLKFVAENPGKNYYSEEKIADKTYYTAVYPDKAVASACANCHNNHADSPRKDFKDGEVMGALVIRIPVSK